MKYFHAHYRLLSPHAGFVPSCCNLRALMLGVSCTFFAIGCADRRPAAKDPEATPPPVTTAPVLAPPHSSNTVGAISESEKTHEHPAPTGRVADDTPGALGAIAAPSDRDPEEDSTPLLGGDAEVPPTATAPAQPSPDATAEEDVSAALRREVAEMERRRARQPRGW